jgi:hypothetical protein
MRAENAAGDALEKAERLGAHHPVDNKSRGDVHDSADGSGGNDRFGRIGHGALLVNPRKILEALRPGANRLKTLRSDLLGGPEIGGAMTEKTR